MWPSGDNGRRGSWDLFNNADSALPDPQLLLAGGGPMTLLPTSGMPPAPISPPTNRSTNNDPVLKAYQRSQFHKTRFCPHFKNYGRCRKDEACNYAHMTEELRPSVNLTKTKLCQDFIHSACHKTADSCPFAHGLSELRSTPGFYKTQMCKFWIGGHCPAGSICRHAHGDTECRVTHVSSPQSSPGGIQALPPQRADQQPQPPRPAGSPPSPADFLPPPPPPSSAPGMTSSFFSHIDYAAAAAAAANNPFLAGLFGQSANELPPSALPPSASPASADLSLSIPSHPNRRAGLLSGVTDDHDFKGDHKSTAQPSHPSDLSPSTSATANAAAAAAAAAVMTPGALEHLPHFVAAAAGADLRGVAAAGGLPLISHALQTLHNIASRQQDPNYGLDRTQYKTHETKPLENGLPAPPSVQPSSALAQPSVLGHDSPSSPLQPKEEGEISNTASEDESHLLSQLFANGSAQEKALINGETKFEGNQQQPSQRKEQKDDVNTLKKEMVQQQQQAQKIGVARDNEMDEPNTGSSAALPMNESDSTELKRPQSDTEQSGTKSPTETKAIFDVVKSPSPSLVPSLSWVSNGQEGTVSGANESGRGRTVMDPQSLSLPPSATMPSRHGLPGNHVTSTGSSNNAHHFASLSAGSATPDSSSIQLASLPVVVSTTPSPVSRGVTGTSIPVTPTLVQPDLLPDEDLSLLLSVSPYHNHASNEHKSVSKTSTQQGLWKDSKSPESLADTPSTSTTHRPLDRLVVSAGDNPLYPSSPAPSNQSYFTMPSSPSPQPSTGPRSPDFTSTPTPAPTPVSTQSEHGDSAHHHPRTVAAAAAAVLSALTTDFSDVASTSLGPLSSLSASPVTPSSAGQPSAPYLSPLPVLVSQSSQSTDPSSSPLSSPPKTKSTDASPSPYSPISALSPEVSFSSQPQPNPPTAATPGQVPPVYYPVSYPLQLPCTLR